MCGNYKYTFYISNMIMIKMPSNQCSLYSQISKTEFIIQVILYMLNTNKGVKHIRVNNHIPLQAAAFIALGFCKYCV